MKFIEIAAVVLLGLLSLAAGFAKVLQVPPEVAFLQSAGLSLTAILAYGSYQIVAAVGLAIPISRRYGALAVALGLAGSTLLIGLAGQLAFAATSILPVALALWLWFKTPATSGAPTTAGNQ